MTDRIIINAYHVATLYWRMQNIEGRTGIESERFDRSERRKEQLDEFLFEK